jgi:hypothetical protein
MAVAGLVKKIQISKYLEPRTNQQRYQTAICKTNGTFVRQTFLRQTFLTQTFLRQTFLTQMKYF